MKEFKKKLQTYLSTIDYPGLSVKRSGNTLKISKSGEKNFCSEISIVYLTRVSGYYLQVHVKGGELHDAISEMNLPTSANQLLCQGVYFHSSLSEKNKQFSPDIGGARLLYPNCDEASICEDTIDRIKRNNLPLIHSVLYLTKDLPNHVLEYTADFSYPLGILAYLQKRGIDETFTRATSDPALRKKFKKEHQIDYKKLLEI